jgi:hypothetical protein
MTPQDDRIKGQIISDVISALNALGQLDGDLDGLIGSDADVIRTEVLDQERLQSWRFALEEIYFRLTGVEYGT